MRIASFKKSHRREFLALLSESKREFGKAWLLRMNEVFSGSSKEPNLRAYAVLDGSRLAAVFATRCEVEAFVLYFILIGKECRRKGVGKMIISAVEKMARKSRAKFLRADIYTGKPILSFYRKMGFKVGGKVRYYEEDGDNQTFLFKKLRLSRAK